MGRESGILSKKSERRESVFFCHILIDSPVDANRLDSLVDFEK